MRSDNLVQSPAISFLDSWKSLLIKTLQVWLYYIVRPGHCLVASCTPSALTLVCLQERQHRRRILLPENPSEETWVPACRPKTPKLPTRSVGWRDGCCHCRAHLTRIRPPAGIPTWPSMSWTWTIRPPATSPSPSAHSARIQSHRPPTPLFPVRYSVRWRPLDRARSPLKGRCSFSSLSLKCSDPGQMRC